jgi:hypothetical protein
LIVCQELATYRLVKLGEQTQQLGLRMKHLIVALAMLSATSCVSTTSRAETDDALDFLNNHPGFVRSYNKPTFTMIYKYKPFGPSTTITIHTYDNKKNGIH